MRTYIGFNLWAEGVKRAKSIDRMKVIEALESGISIDDAGRQDHARPARRTISRSTSSWPRCANHGFKVLETFPQQPPLDTASVCDLKAPEREQAIRRRREDLSAGRLLDFAVVVALQIVLSGSRPC